MSIDAQVANFIAHPQPARFEQLALAVFAHQFGRIEPYRRFCLERGASPSSVRMLAEIPPVSTAAFKYVTFSSAPPQRIFLTSGTTRGRDQRGRHFMADLRHYQASAISHLARMLFPDRRRLWMLALHPTADLMPESSLSQMISWCIESFGAGCNRCCATPQRVDTEAATAFLRAAQTAGEAVCILGTTAALSTLFEHLGAISARLNLPPGSRLMDTGGAKGQSRPLLPHEVVEMAQYYLAIGAPLVINEYGMTELSSQLYDATPFNCPELAIDEGRVKVAPPWLRVIARDPATLRPVEAGETGVLSFFDLANVGSVSALLTEDLGTVRAEGTVRIFGRALASDPRGCALGIEQFAQETVRTVAGPRIGSSGEFAERITNGHAAPGIEAIVAEVRRAAAVALDRRRIADALGRTCCKWRETGLEGRIATLRRAIALSGQSEELLGASLDASLRNFTPGSLDELAYGLSASGRLIGLIMPGNVMGAGLHELVQALIAGAGVIVKAASDEPFFFAEFHRTLAATDPDVAARMRVIVWSRFDRDSTRALVAHCDHVAALGDDETMADLTAVAGPKLVDFGSRLSGALLAREAICGPQAPAVAGALARDVTLFDQRGCLSLHHIFVETPSVSEARSFAAILAHEIAELAQLLAPPATLRITDAAAARGTRENARWRAIGGEPVGLWEGADLGWTVIFDPEAEFEASPLCRTVRVSMVKNHDELAKRLVSAAGRLEGFAIADPAQRLRDSRTLLEGLSVSYLCAPGLMQSPPPSWAHGGGRLLNLLVRRDG